MKLLACVCLGLVSASCAIGAPPGFSDGETWTFPLVGPLESGAYLTPVSVNGQGPWLFLVDPDLPASAIDSGLVSELKPLTEPAAQVVNSHDHRKPIGRVRVKEITVGDLTVHDRVVFVKPQLLVRGRWVRGVLGRDVLAQSLVFAVDRDRGVATLATQGNLEAPADAQKIEYRLSSDRYLAPVKINDKYEATLHLDLGNHTSTLWVDKQKEFGLPRIPKKDVLMDEFGYTTDVDRVAMAAKVKAGDVENTGIEFAPMSDERIEPEDYDGELGQNFFRSFNMVVNFHHTTMWLKHRTNDIIGTASERMRRWKPPADSCESPACVKVTLRPIGGTTCPAPAARAAGDGAAGDAAAAPAAGAGDGAGAAAAGEMPGAPAAGDATGGAASGDAAAVNAGGDAAAAGGAAAPAAGGSATPAAPAGDCTPKAPEFYQLMITRESGAVDKTYEVTLLAVDDDMQPIGTPPLVAALPKGAEAIYQPLTNPAYARAKAFVPIDMSPFPRVCERIGKGYRCVWEME